MNTAVTFGLFVSMMRGKHDLTLREFCRKAKVDPSNWSKVERGLTPPPKSKTTITNVAKALKLTDTERSQLNDLVAVGLIPKGFVRQDVLLKLPLFIRTLRGEKPTEEELKLLWVSLIKSNRKL